MLRTWWITCEIWNVNDSAQNWVQGTHYKQKEKKINKIYLQTVLLRERELVHRNGSVDTFHRVLKYHDFCFWFSELLNNPILNLNVNFILFACNKIQRRLAKIVFHMFKFCVDFTRQFTFLFRLYMYKSIQCAFQMCLHYFNKLSK